MSVIKRVHQPTVYTKIVASTSLRDNKGAESINAFCPKHSNSDEGYVF